MDRRQFFADTARRLGLAGCGAVAWRWLLTTDAQASVLAIRPPGALTEADFAAQCIKCGQCAAACPYDTLKMATPADRAAIGTPYFTPRDVPCYMCQDLPCTRACPTGALSPELKRVEDARMGLAVLDRENCLSWQGLRCEICYRECPVKGKAITLEERRRELSKHAMFLPVIHASDCTGCGLCERACPTEKAAIRVVNPNLVVGEIGKHYRLGWKEPVPQLNAQPAEGPGAAPPASAHAPMPPEAPAPSQAPGMDYLNSGEL
jgi:ferredoxin-type protein NapG